jgi:hypothetical protein
MEAYCSNLADYEKYLIVNNLVPAEKTRYYSNWADKYLHGINYNTAAINQNTFSCFVGNMRKDSKYTDWQIRQAENAVRMNIINFLKLKMKIVLITLTHGATICRPLQGLNEKQLDSLL